MIIRRCSALLYGVVVAAGALVCLEVIHRIRETEMVVSPLISCTATSQPGPVNNENVLTSAPS